MVILAAALGRAPRALAGLCVAARRQSRRHCDQKRRVADFDLHFIFPYDYLDQRSTEYPGNEARGGRASAVTFEV